MYDEDDLSILDEAVELDSPLDHLGALTADSEVAKPNPEAMLALLENLPLARAAARPASVRSRIKFLSNSAKDASSACLLRN